jgi:hypothetical protein
MRRISYVLAALMVFSFGLSYAQTAICDIAGAPTGTWAGGTKVTVDKPVTWTVFMEVGSYTITGQTNGFKVFLSDFAGGYPIDNAGTFSPIVGTMVYDFPGIAYDGGFFINPFSVDGLAVDTMGFGGFKIIGKPGVVGPIHIEPAWTISTQVGASYDGSGSYLCLDTSFYPPGGAWLWSTTAGSIQPVWGGPYCYLIEKEPNQAAEFDNCPGATQVFGHCTVASFQFLGHDPDPAQCEIGTGVTFSKVSGIGAVSAAGLWSYAPTLGDVGTTFEIVARVEDKCGAGTNCTFHVEFTNVGPSIACGPGGVIGKGNPLVYTGVSGSDGDCDPVSYSIVDVTPTPVGTYSIDANNGDITFNTDELDGPPPSGQVFTFTVQISDGDKVATCDATIEVLATEPWEIQISKEHDVYQGMHRMVDVSVNKGSEDMKGFDLLIAYDASALSFQTAVEGEIYDLCGWEYFTYRYGANGNCGN